MVGLGKYPANMSDIGPHLAYAVAQVGLQVLV